MMVENLKNIVPKTAKSLNELNIVTLEDIETYRLVSALTRLEPKTGLNELWALPAACLNISWQCLAKEIKGKLLLELDSLK